jgi:hypothetical protein
MEDETPIPPTQPSGALVPPTRIPPTALATLPAPLPHGRPPTPRAYAELRGFERFFARTLDAVDEFADTVAENLGLR